MSFSKKVLTLAAPLALLGLSACATGLPTQVKRFQALPAPSGQTFWIQSADVRDQGGLEFAQYADLVRRAMAAQGYVPAPSAQSAAFIVNLDYGVDNGQTRVVSRPGFGGYGGFGYGFGFRRHYSRFGYFGGYRSPFYYGWDDPFWGGGGVDSYTVFTSYLDLDIKRAADGQSLFEGTAKARSRTDDLRVLVPNLVEAMFTGFPGNSGEVVRITVPTDPRRRG
jgi:hypothetical protein